MADVNKILRTVKRLFPKGRAFRISKDSFNERIEQTQILTKKEALDDMKGILSQAVPDSITTSDEATLWENRLGLPVNTSLALADRIAAIQRKYKHPGTILARQSVDYIEDQLALANFSQVKVFENIPRQDPQGFAPVEENFIFETSTDWQHGTETQHGYPYKGSIFKDVIANSLQADRDEFFNVGDELGAIFYLGGTPLGTYVNVDASRELEFRQLILKLKPASHTAILFINFV